ncbi:unnamed protein product [Paramecium primaurelia]|uniref:Uncharacterized protein n=1 Tax=Paramecium primaurelia TaxID=5886 RepID=A0A8S1NNX1_PARPR|nr:unnamed protein product [Paramecium primaurelia]
MNKYLKFCQKYFVRKMLKMFKAAQDIFQMMEIKKILIIFHSRREVNIS